MGGMYDPAQVFLHHQAPHHPACFPPQEDFTEKRELTFLTDV